jgi:plasmid stabilization system protein ParE
MAFKVHVSDQGWRDTEQVMAATFINFGERNQEEYWELITAALRELDRHPERAKLRTDLPPNVRTFHIARRGKRADTFC